MAYFSAMGGAGGAGAGATLTVTYSEDFYGTTITATNGTRTLTKLATSSGSVEFKLPEDGTWTVSATVEGQLYEESVLVDTSYNTELSALPNGSTATPVNVIQTWLKCAQIRDKAYTTLSQVLNDTATLEALVSDSNACDYMVRSTNWASGIVADANAMALIGKFDYCANKLLSNSTWSTAIANSTYFESVLNVKVPTMTSDTTPSGQVIYTNQNANYPKWHVFDGNNTSNANAGGTDFTVGYKFTQPVSIKRVYHYTDNTSYKGFGTNAVLQYSDDGVTWTGSANIGGQADTQPHTAIISDNYGYHTYWRVNDDRNWFCSVLQFYGRTDTMIPLVPKMTSNTTPSGEVDASAEWTAQNFNKWKAFNQNETNGWLNDSVAPYIHVNDWLSYEFTSSVKVALARVTWLYQMQVATVSGKIQAYDGANWVDVSSEVQITSNAQNTPTDINVTVGNNTYTKYRWICTTQPSSNYGFGIKLQFYTSADPATQVLFRSAAQDDLYYMDNGSPVIIAHTDWNGYAIVDRELLPEGVNLTVYSTVAKDPSSLGSAYSRVIHFSKYLTDVYLRPFEVLSWFGYLDSRLGDASQYGWSQQYMPQGGSMCTYNTNDIIQYTNNSTSWQGVATISLLDMSNISHIKAIASFTTAGSGYHNTAAGAYSQNNYDSYTVYDNVTDSVSTRLFNVDTSSLTGNQYIAYWTYGGTATLYALWYE